MKIHSLSCLILLGALVLYPLSFSSGQKPYERWSRYLSSKERATEYEKARFEPSDNGIGPVLDCVWITPSIAQSIVSSTVEREKVDSNEAERRYAWLRQDFHLILVSIYLDYMLIKSEARFFLLTDKGTAFPGEVVKPPFTIKFFMMSDGPRTPTYLVRFPRRDAIGRDTISSVANKVEIVIQFPKHQAVVPVSVKKLIKIGAEL